MSNKLTRRKFIQTSAVATAALTTGMSAPDGVLLPQMGKVDTGKILNYNPDMEYRRCGRTGLMVGAVALGGHWKRIDKIIGGVTSRGWMRIDGNRPDFQKNRYDVVTRCIQRGINYVDACSREEVVTYAKALKGRRDEMYLGYSCDACESSHAALSSREKLQEDMDRGMKEAGLDYVDVWRLSLLVDSAQHTEAEIDEAMAALDWAKETGRARFIGVSSHDRRHLKKLIETYPDQMEVLLVPYTANTKLVTDETGLRATVKKYDVGWFGIKPFASNSLFKGDSSPGSPTFEEDNRLARLAIRYVLCNDAITAPIPGLITEQQVDNACLAVMERRELDNEEKDELARAMKRAWDGLPADYQWLRDWEYV